MHVVKRNGKAERVHFDKITSRISKLAYGLNQEFVDPVLISQKCVKGVFNGVTTAELDSLAAETAVRTNPSPNHFPLHMPSSLPRLVASICPSSQLKLSVAQAYMTMDHPDYSVLAARIAVSNLHKMTKKVPPACMRPSPVGTPRLVHLNCAFREGRGSEGGRRGVQVFSEVVTDCYDFIDEASGRPSKLIADDVYGIIMANKVWPPKPFVHLSPHGRLPPHAPPNFRALPRVPPPHVPTLSRCLPPPACRNVA